MSDMEYNSKKIVLLSIYTCWQKFDKNYENTLLEQFSRI
jgi:hypothetical protein